MYDNRTAELAEWNIEQLQIDQAAGLDLQPWWTDGERERLTEMFDIATTGPPLLSSAGRPHFQQMTFTLHDDQVATVKAALARAQADGCMSPINENTNGNALAHLAARYLHG